MTIIVFTFYTLMADELPTSVVIAALAADCLLGCVLGSAYLIVRGY